MNPQFDDLWVYLQANPLGWLTATLIAYWLGVQAQRAAGGRPYVNPVAIAVVLVVALLVGDRHAVPDLFRGRAVRAFPARPGDRRARRAAVPALAGGEAQPRRR